MELAGPPQGDYRVEGLFASPYEPEKIHFLLYHWQELTELASRRRSSAQLEADLEREWLVLASLPYSGKFNAPCLCGTAGSGSTPPATSGRRLGAARHSVASIVADLERAADA